MDILHNLVRTALLWDQERLAVEFLRNAPQGQ
jgi:hypothetical protein